MYRSKRLRIPWALSVVCLVGLAGGCTESATQNTASPAPAAEVSPMEQWRVAGSMPDVTRAVDGNLQTYAAAAKGSGQAMLTIDLSKPCLFNLMVIEHGPVEQGHARRLTLLTSPDGETFTPQMQVEGTPKRTYVAILTPTLARFVRIQAEVDDNRPWTIAEIYFQ
ncbi:MAG: discoidin domain-containing protein [Planctomycetota bacterium]